MDTKRIAFFAAGVLAAIIIIIIIVTTLRPSGPGQTATTPSPAQTITNPQLAASTLSVKEKSHIDTITRLDYSRLSTSEKTRLDTFKTKLPYRSDSFDIEYVPVIGRYVIYLKKSTEAQTLNNYLIAQNVYDVYSRGSMVFILTSEPIDTTVAKVITALQEDTYHGGLGDQGVVKGTQVHAQAPNTVGDSRDDSPTDEDMTGAMNIFKAITTFNLGGGVQETGGTAGAGITTTGTGVATANDAEFVRRAGAPDARGYYHMPPPVNGEYELSSCEAHQYGGIEILTILNQIAFQWKAKYPDSVLRIWDINADGPHLSHGVGIDVDIDISNLSAANMCSDFYNQPATDQQNCAGLSEGQCRSIELGKMALQSNQIQMIFYDDPAVNEKITEYAHNNGKNQFILIEPWGTQACGAGHHDHFHLRTLDQYTKEVWHPSC